MKKYLVCLDFNHYYLVVEKSYYDIHYTKVTDYFYKFITEDKQPDYSNKTENYCSSKIHSKIKNVLTEGIFNDFDFKRLYDESEMVEIYKWAD